MSLAPSQQGCAGHWLFPCGTTPPHVPACCAAAPPDLRSSPGLVNWTRALIFLVISPTYLSLPRYLFLLVTFTSTFFLLSPIFWSQCPSCSCPCWPAPVHNSHCSPQTLPCPLQNSGLLCSVLFQPSSNWGIVSRFVLKIKELNEFPRCPHWKCLKNKSS